MRPERPQWHGTVNGYINRRCRCDDCRAAHTAYKRAYRYARYGPPKPRNGPTHGLASTYIHSHCRCDDCRAAARDHRWKMRHNAAARAGHEIAQVRDWVIDYRIGRIA